MKFLYSVLISFLITMGIFSMSTIFYYFVSIALESAPIERIFGVVFLGILAVVYLTVRSEKDSHRYYGGSL